MTTMPIGADEVRNFLPHRFPFLMIDRVIEMDVKGDVVNLAGNESKVGSKIVAVKMISQNESVFQGHFPSRSIFPGVMTLEALAQTACFTLYPGIQVQPQKTSFQVALVGMNDVKFRRPVVPGDRLVLEAVVKKARTSIWVFDAKAYVDDKVVCETELMAQISFSVEGEKSV